MDNSVEKKLLICRLRKMKEDMSLNADIMRDLYPDSTHHKELKGASLITQTWINGFTKELSDNSNNKSFQ